MQAQSRPQQRIGTKHLPRRFGKWTSGKGSRHRGLPRLLPHKWRFPRRGRGAAGGPGRGAAGQPSSRGGAGGGWPAGAGGGRLAGRGGARGGRPAGTGQWPVGRGGGRPQRELFLHYSPLLGWLARHCLETASCSRQTSSIRAVSPGPLAPWPPGPLAPRPLAPWPPGPLAPWPHWPPSSKSRNFKN